MKSVLLALVASTAIAGAAMAQQTAPTATDTETDATTVPAQQAAPATSSDAVPAGEDPLAPESEQEATTATPRILPQTGTAAPAAGVDPSAPESEQDATTVAPQ